MSTAAKTLQPIPYLSFDKNCAEAMKFYERVLSGKITVMMTCGDSPMADQMPADQKDFVLNAQLELPGGALLMGGDCPGHMQYEGIKGVNITLNYETIEEGEKAFNALAEGGHIMMPYADTFWAKKFGMLTDKFGVHWIINGEIIPLS